MEIPACVCLRFFSFLWLLVGMLEGTESEQVIDRYGSKGKSFLLDVGGVKPAEFRQFYWKLNNTQTIVEYTSKNNEFEIFPRYKEKVMFYEKNFSLKILKLEESNRGIYTAITQDIHGKDKNIVIYRLIPQDSVIKPELKVKSASVSEERCNISATCTVGQDNSVSYRCQQTQCTEVGRDYTESDDLEIVVTVKNSSIVCNASNRVSNDSHSLALKDVCRNSEPHNAAGIIGVTAGTILTILIISILSIYVCVKKNRRATNQDGNLEPLNTTYASVQETSAPPPVETLYAAVGPRECQSKPVKHPEETTIYCTVQGAHINS